MQNMIEIMEMFLNLPFAETKESCVSIKNYNIHPVSDHSDSDRKKSHRILQSNCIYSMKKRKEKLELFPFGRNVV